MSEFNRMLAECYRVYRWSQMGETLSDGLERLGWVIVMRLLTGLGKK
ncbi:MAG: hypothetical protein OSA08_08155 [Arenicellales bacterium]|nr:hypothetical protein [Arenicellales bacterium]